MVKELKKEHKIHTFSVLTHKILITMGILHKKKLTSSSILGINIYLGHDTLVGHC